MKVVENRRDFLVEIRKLIPNSSLCAELGVLYGDFSQNILDELLPSRLYLIDPYELGTETYLSGLPTSYSTNSDYEALLSKLADPIKLDRVVVDRRTSVQAVKDYPDGFFDFIYIDASHLYQDVIRDLRDWAPKLKSNGLLCGHDYIHDPEFGVIRAVDEFVASTNFEMILFNKNGGDFSLKQK